MTRKTFLTLALALVLFPPSHLSGQIVRGQVLEAGEGNPVSGAFIVLLDEAGKRRAAVLADSLGFFILRAPGAGRYTLRVERIGFAATSSSAFDLEKDQTHRERIPVPIEPISLEGITASGTGRCRTPRKVGAETSVLWEEARKALSISEWVRSDRGVPYQTMRWERRRHLLDLSIDEQNTFLKSGYGRSAFRSEDVQNLSSEGYVRHLGDGSYEYFGPDAASLLSDDFLDTHCFTIRDPDSGETGLVGLGFEPIPGHDPPDIAGVLWLDRSTAELRFLEFTFTRHLHPTAVPLDPFGGRVEFRRLANGVWIVDHWWLRMPLFPQNQRWAGPRAGEPPPRWERDRLMAAFRAGLNVWEEGGRVQFFRKPSERTSGRASVEGIVYDSTRTRPLRGATVFLTGTRHATQTDLRGRFVLNGIPSGENAIAFIHPYADSLGLPVAPRPITLPNAGRIKVNLTVPRGEGCFNSSEDSVIPAIAGFVVDSETGDPLAGAVVRAEWRSEVSEMRGSVRITRERVVTTGQDGRFFLCGFSAGAKVQLTAEHPTGEASVEIEIEGPGLVLQSLLIG